VDASWEPPGNAHANAVLLHGVSSLAGTWWRIGPALARRGLRATALDLAAHGGRPAPPGPLTIDALAEDVAGRLPPRPVDLLVGHSLGAVVALALATRDGGGPFGALVLEDPPGRSGVDAAALAEGIVADGELVRRDRARLVAREHAANPRWAGEDVERSVDGIAQTDAVAVAAGLRGTLAWDLPALVADAPAPALVLVAPEERSALKGPERAAVGAALGPGRVVELDGGHCLHRDDPDAWLGAVDAVLPRA